MQHLFCALLLSLSLLAAGCDRRPHGTATAPAPIQGAAGDLDPALWGRLPFHIDAVYQNQQPAEPFPGHIDGGTWTFFDCSAAGAHFVVGIQSDPPLPPPLPPASPPGGEADQSAPPADLPATRGRAILRTADRAAADAFLAAFAEGFHTRVPEALPPKPLRPQVFRTALMGAALDRNPSGNGFLLGGGGAWTATQWSVSTPRLEADVFFNYNLAAGQGEFAEKEAAQREDLLALWARLLRDGPRGQRTPQEDPNVVASGPHLGALTPIAGPEARHPFFVPGGKFLLYSAAEPGRPAQVWAVECAAPQNRRELMELPVIYQVRCVDPAGRHLLVEEKVPDLPGLVTSADPSRFWWIDAAAGKARTIPGPWNARDIDCDPQALSPDSHYLVLSENRIRDGGAGGYTQLYLIDLLSFKASTLDIRQQWIETCGWRGQDDTLRLIVRTGLPSDPPEQRQACLVAPDSGDWLPAPPNEAPPPPAGLIPAPDGQNTAAVLDRQRLEIRRASGVTRTLAFNPEDRHFVDEGCVAWVNNRYLSFFNPYPILIDTRIMKMNYVLANDLVPNDVLYSPDFKFAAVETPEALLLAPVIEPNP